MHKSNILCAVCSNMMVTYILIYYIWFSYIQYDKKRHHISSRYTINLTVQSLSALKHRLTLQLHSNAFTAYAWTVIFTVCSAYWHFNCLQCVHLNWNLTCFHPLRFNWFQMLSSCFISAATLSTLSVLTIQLTCQVLSLLQHFNGHFSSFQCFKFDRRFNTETLSSCQCLLLNRQVKRFDCLHFNWHFKPCQCFKLNWHFNSFERFNFSCNSWISQENN